MPHTIALKLKPETYQCFQEIYTQLNAGDKNNLAKPLGENLADIACEVIDQVFGQMVTLSNSGDKESEKVLGQIFDTLRKYMPWSVSFFGNERLIPMVNYLENLIEVKDGENYLTYQVDHHLITELLGHVEHIKQERDQYIVPALKTFTQVVDQGVTSLIREPKKMLKFNLVIDKTLNGVINVTTQLGYKRFDKLGTMHDAKTLSQFFEHFLNFLDTTPKN
ncbi:hypothetical protein [Acinetobacter sp. ANC 4648]|uniref:hypothetical protein n=1 Tax=Acinetobacter sp. ANC 4648 TaxID=1977875 RepID=UPI000A3473A3|nr:hypothetical protein [Acinetobacter sp. ANC 4648]OTG81026.1 hypothetical protein B9T27_11195 [Acinetobacter sp. ANC 4648]